jgi:hypothetical protein
MAKPELISAYGYWRQQLMLFLQDLTGQTSAISGCQ